MPLPCPILIRPLMNRILARAARMAAIVAAVATGAINSQARETDEEAYDRLARRFDVADQVREVPADSASLFWSTLLATDPTFTRFVADFRSDSYRAREASGRLDMLPRFRREAALTLVDSLQGRCDSLAAALGFNPRFCRLHVAAGSEPEALAALSGASGFAILTSEALWTRLTPDEAEAAVVREYVHGSMLHHLQQEYALDCTDRRLRLWDVVLFTFAPRVAMALEEIRREKAELVADELLRRRLKALTVEATDCEISGFRYTFCDEMEIQADIVAYRFMERRGKGEAFIEMLGRIDRASAAAADPLFSVDGDNPSLAFRRGLLRFIAANPDLNAWRKKRREAERLRDAIYD